MYSYNFLSRSLTLTGGFGEVKKGGRTACMKGLTSHVNPLVPIDFYVYYISYLPEDKFISYN